MLETKEIRIDVMGPARSGDALVASQVIEPSPTRGGRAPAHVVHLLDLWSPLEARSRVTSMTRRLAGSPP